MKPSVFCVALALAALGRLPSSHAGLLISEIMHHPGSGLPVEQFVELQNTDPTPASLHGWRLTGQVDFTFTNQVIPGGGFLVVVANVPAFTAHYPGVTNYVGNWTGMLENQGSIRLRNATNDVVASAHYYSEGDWSERGLLPNLGIVGWEWTGLHDGGGSSLELVNPLLPADAGQNWDSSIDIDGTPGAPNSVHQINSAPLITGVAHRPIVPSPGDPVTVVAHLLDEPGSGAPTASLHWRVDASPTNAFQVLPMVDDGSHGDGAARDGTYGAVLPAMSLGSIVEYFITTADAEGHTRTYPRVDPLANRSANLVYQVDTSAPNGNIPLYRVILTAAEKLALDSANSTQALSDAGSSGAFVTQDASGIEIRQLVTFRNRGHGSRYNFPHNIKVAIPADDAWNGRTGINLNSGTPFLQMVGSAVMREIGLIMAESRLVTVLVNGVNHAGNGAPLYQYGYFAANWEMNSDLIAAQAPDDAGGNIYRTIRNRISGNRTGNLVWHGTNSQAYADPYFKQNHSLANDWSDLIDLIAVLNSTNGYAASNYVTDVGHRLNVKQWMRYFASQTILDNQETNLSTGYGDDYAVYAGLRDPRFLLLPYDLDSIFHFSNASPFDSLFRMAIPGVGSDVAAIDRLIKTPEFVRLYYTELKELAQGPLSDAALSPLLDRLLTGTTIPAAIVADMKAFNASRVSFILSQIPTELTVSSNLPVANGYFRSTNSAIRLEGRSDATRTARVLVAGVPATWTVWTAHWVSTNVNLNPGINRLLVTALDEYDVEFDRKLVDVWSDTGTTTPAQTTIATPTRWTAAEGPYTITGTLIIAAGGSLTLDPGTTVYMSGGASLRVANGGRWDAHGTASAPIYFGRAPGGPTWGGIVINGSAQSPECHLSHIHFEGNGTICIEVADGTLALDHATFGTTTYQYLSLDRASFHLTDCTFPTATSAFELVHGTGGIKAGGRGIVQRCFFGATMGYNDAMDFTGGNRNLGQPIVQFYHNVFSGGSDDLLDLDGTDAWIEGNLFLHCHANGTPDSASAVSGGSDSGQTSEITLIDNLFFDCDQAATAKEGNFFTLLNNTIVHMNHAGGLDTTAAVVNVRDFPSGGTPTAFGRGHYLEGNIITDVEGLVRNYDLGQVAVTFNRNLLPAAWTGPGVGNQITDDPQLTHLPTVGETRFTNWTSAQVLWDWLRPLPGSPARGAGPGGSGWGARRFSGVRLAGIPTGAVREGDIFVSVGPNLNASEASLPAAGWPQGAGYIAYRWRLDDGPWSAPTPIRTPVSLTNLSAGSHHLEVAGQRDSGLYQDDPILGMDAGTTSSATWIVDPLAPSANSIQRLQLSEILASNTSLVLAPGFTPDLVEIHNPTDAMLDLAGIGVTTSVKNPFRFTFPAGTTLNAHGYLVLLAENNPPPGITQLNLGFDLSHSGDSLYLYSPATNLIDQVSFGGQLPDFSIGRRPDGGWSLGIPSFGEPNRTTPMGSPSALRLNEWLASHRFLAAEDYIEIYNTDPRPVDLGGLFLSHAPASPQQYGIPSLNFIGGHDFRIFLADGQDQPPDHLNFSLDRQAGFIGLSAGDAQPIDVIVYGPQREDMPEGRTPNGGGLITFLSGPSPGASNPGSNVGDPGSTNIVTITLPLITMTNQWRFSQSGDLATRWREPAYDDTTWSGGAALLYVETSALPAPKNTPLTLGKTTYYFRGHFNLPTDVPALQLLLTSIVDDGAIMWLNGHELYRLGMDPGTVVYGTLANRTVGNAVVEGPFEVPSTWLNSGDNVLAVEVHQSAASSSDVVFGATLDAT